MTVTTKYVPMWRVKVSLNAGPMAPQLPPLTTIDVVGIEGVTEIVRQHAEAMLGSLKYQHDIGASTVGARFVLDVEEVKG